MLWSILAVVLSVHSADESMPSSINEVCRVQTSVVAGAPAVGRMTDRDLTLVIALELDEDWHTYWWDAGSWGSPPRLQVDAPEGWHCLLYTSPSPRD